VIARIQVILFSIAVATGLLDVVWIRLGHFDVDAPAYSALALLAALLAGGGAYYQHRRDEPALAAMLTGTGFLLLFSTSFSVLNTILITVPGHRIDGTLAAVDRAAGFYWPAMIAWAAAHPLTNAILQLAYISVLPQIALTIVLLGWCRRPVQIYEFCLAVAAGAVIAIGIWTFARSLGTLTVYHLPTDIVRHVALACDPAYGERLLWMMAHGPGYITPRDMKGLIAFPSFHAVLALLVVWSVRRVPVIRWIALALNMLVLFSIPIQGGHHVIDVAAGIGVAVLAAVSAKATMSFASRPRDRLVLSAQPVL